MATLTELLRAAEHMRQQGALMIEDERWHVGMSYCEAADMLEREAASLRVVEAQQSKRSWPEGWPPFAVLRRAYRLTGLRHSPSTMVVERAREYRSEVLRENWENALKVVFSTIPSSP